MDQITLFGAHVSPYVRKVHLVLEYKELKYQHVPVIPFSPEKPKVFLENSPLGKIPLLQKGEHFIPDSSVICAFLEREYPEKPLLPADNYDYARALWFEEYAAGHMTSVIGGHLFAEKILAKIVFKREPNQAEIDLAVDTEIPAIFDYLSSELSRPSQRSAEQQYLVGESISLADIAVCGMFVAMDHCGVVCDPTRWPSVAAYIQRITSLPFFQKVIKEEQMILKAFSQ